MLPKTSAYVKSYNGQPKWMYFLIEGYNLLEKYNTTWLKDKVSADIKKNSMASEPVYNKDFLKIKINLMAMKLQIFTKKKLGSNHTCSTAIRLDSALKTDGN